MYSQIKITGQVLKVIKKEYEGKESYQLQFMINDVKKGFEVKQKIKKSFDFVVLDAWNYPKHGYSDAKKKQAGSKPYRVTSSSIVAKPGQKSTDCGTASISNASSSKN